VPAVVLRPYQVWFMQIDQLEDLRRVQNMGFPLTTAEMRCSSKNNP
jgi:hypothetical protein